MTQIDHETIEIDSATALPRGKSGNIAAYEDVNSDGYLDAIYRFDVPSLALTPGDHWLELTGNLLPAFGGTPIWGSDLVRVV